MARVITFSRTYPSYHPKKGQPTYFVEKVVNSLCPITEAEDIMAYYYACMPNDIQIDSLVGFLPKGHTIRAGNRWKKGDVFSPRVWTGKPYASKQLAFAPDVTIKKVWNFQIKAKNKEVYYMIIGKRKYIIYISINSGTMLFPKVLLELAKNDGLSRQDLLSWFRFPKPFKGQIICWDSNIKY